MTNTDMKIVDMVTCDFLGRFRVMHLLGDSSGDGCFVDASSIHLGAHIYDSDIKLMPAASRQFLLNGVLKDVNICNMSRACPRTLLTNLVNQLADEGYEVKIGIEPEFFLLNKDGTPTDSKQYMFHVELNGFEHELIRTMFAAGLEPTRFHHEVAPGQYEFGFKYADPVTAGDNLIIFKLIVHQLAAKYGFKASFHPKPFPELSGSGMHVHSSIWKNGVNLFSNEPNLSSLGGDTNISDLAKSYVEGLLTYSKDFTLLFASEDEAYVRLGGNEAPKNICVGCSNRSALVRIPAHSKAEATTVEFRAPNPHNNPYLVFSAMISAGMLGIRQNLKMREPITTSAYAVDGIETLPQSLDEALDIARSSSFLKSVLGDIHPQLISVFTKRH